MNVPYPCIAWLVENVASSNSELASFSNVSRHWRQCVVQSILEQVNKRFLLDGGEQEDDDDEAEQRSPLLLLPSMARYIVCSQQNDGAASARENDNQNHDTFCAAWFDPSGIQLYCLEAEDSEDDDRVQWWPVISKEELLQHSHDITLCCPEWRGMREPMQVLQCFGYAYDFVSQVLEGAVEMRQKRQLRERQSEEIMQVDATEQDHVDDSTASGAQQQRQPQHYETTFAVRGATLARPEGYCLCWENDNTFIMNGTHHQSPDDESENLFLQQQAAYRRRLSKRALHRDALPRVVLSSPQKYPFDPNYMGPSLPCVQFLNSTRSHAVRMKTLPFDCGVINEPVTIVCVGIATEDGCFLSGLSNRFELGHMYPTNTQDDLIDMSPVCIATQPAPRILPAPPSRSSSNAGDSASHVSSGASYTFSAGSESDSESSGVSYDTYGNNRQMTCQCPFGAANLDQTNDYSNYNHNCEPAERQIRARGQHGPGAWHCYVAIFDGSESSIRVDGIVQTQKAPNQGDGSSPFSSGMDGLTIGSDHCFNMSLCMGEHSDGEVGEGAISELIVWKGRLPESDLIMLEQSLMTNHGIASARGYRQQLLLQDQRHRTARAMIAQPPPWELIQPRRGIPLRTMAQDRSVAWHRRSAVTGMAARTILIGSKFSTGSSSDW